MNSNNLEKMGLIYSPKVEQAMAWLVDEGPLHRTPHLPAWMLRNLTTGQRIARLRRGVYLAPQVSGRMPGLLPTAQLLEPAGYISFYSALVEHNLTDQDSALCVMVAPVRQRSVHYGQFRIHFVPWPRRLKSAATLTLRRDNITLRLATPIQALLDSLEAPRFSPSAPEMFRMLRDGLDFKKITLRPLLRQAVGLNSPAVARRLGFLLELATGEVYPELLEISMRSHAWTRFDDAEPRARESRWRLLLPRSGSAIVMAAR